MATFNINVNAYENKPPTIGDGTQETEYGEAITLTRADFTTNTNPPYNDPEGDAPLNLKITGLPTGGMLALNGTGVTLNQEIPFTEIDAGNLTYAPDLDNLAEHTVDFTFEISDEGSNTYAS